MTFKFSSVFLPAAGVNNDYSHQIGTTGGTGAVAFSVTGGTLPPGLTLSSSGVLSGVATQIGLFNFILTIVDSVSATRTEGFQFTVMNLVTLSDITVDQTQFVQQLQDTLSVKQAWSTGLTTQTSQTLIELISAVGTFDISRIVRAKEDAFPDTAQSDSALRAIANMQGLRLSRKLPSTVQVTLTSAVSQTFDPFTQFTGGGYNWFNTDQLVVNAGVPLNAILREGLVKTVTLSGRGSDLQAWVSPEDTFKVSDQDVKVAINSATVNKSFGGLWNFKDLQAYADSTLSDGRLIIQFGSRNYGAVPGVNDIVTITYALTLGSTVNGASLSGAKMSVAGNSSISITFVSNPSGGADEKSALSYKNFASGTFGTYSSAVTKSQYHAIVNNYPGIVDAVTQAQREINPAALEWMNIIRVSGLTGSPWSAAQIQDFVEYAESVTMYSTKFVWQDPVPVDVDIDLSVYCFNSVPSTASITAKVENAIRNLFSARAGILLTNFYISDLVETVMNSAEGQISYVEVHAPSSPMIVTLPPSPHASYVIGTGGTLTPRLYDYAISADKPSLIPGGSDDIGNPSFWVFPQVIATGSKVTLDWTADPTYGALRYHVWGRRAGHIGKLATLAPTVTTYTDLGGADPVVEPINISQSIIRYNRLRNLKVTTNYASRQSRATFPVRDVLS
jgi:hypothetical protein